MKNIKNKTKEIKNEDEPIADIQLKISEGKYIHIVGKFPITLDCDY